HFPGNRQNYFKNYGQWIESSCREYKRTWKRIGQTTSEDDISSRTDDGCSKLCPQKERQKSHCKGCGCALFFHYPLWSLQGTYVQTLVSYSCMDSIQSRLLNTG